MPLQNRCDPFGALHAVGARGTMMGNRGGRIHDPDTKQLKNRRWASRAWISCVTDFRGRQHDVWGRTYTVMFFLDEVTALAAGHRPCFECRNADAKNFATLWAGSAERPGRMMAGEMDEILHEERLANREDNRAIGPEEIAALPAGAMVHIGGDAFAVKDGQLLPWSFGGYGKPEKLAGRSGILITPASIVAVLDVGFRPVWHRSAEADRRI